MVYDGGFYALIIPSLLFKIQNRKVETHNRKYCTRSPERFAGAK